VHVLDLPDGGVSDRINEGSEMVAEIVEQIEPRIIITFPPSGMNAHPDHAATQRIVERALAYGNRAPIGLYYFARLQADVTRRPSTRGARRPWEPRRPHRSSQSASRRVAGTSAVLEGQKRGRAPPPVLTIAQVGRLLAQARLGTDKAAPPAFKRPRAARLACL